MSIGERVRKLREERGMTQAELAMEVGTCQHTMIASIEKGTKALPLMTAITIAKVFGITLDELCREEVQYGSSNKAGERVVYAGIYGRVHGGYGKEARGE